MQTFTKHFLCLALLLPFQVMIANTPVQPCEQVQAKSQFVYLSTEMRRAVECLHRMLPEHKWSLEFKDVCDRIAKDGIAAPAEQAEAVVVECLNLLDGQNCAELQEVQEAIKRYAEALRNGDATIVIVDDAMVTRACGSCNTDCNTNCNSKCIKYKGTKAFCNLFAQDLQVPGSGYIANLTSNQFRVTGDAVISGNLTVDGEIFTTDEEISFTDLIVDNLTVNGIFTTNGPVNMGTNASDDIINIGTNASAGREVNIGSDIGTSVTTILGDTSSLVLGSPANSANLNATGNINIATEATTGVVSIGTGVGVGGQVAIGSLDATNAILSENLTISTDSSLVSTSTNTSFLSNSSFTANAPTVGLSINPVAATINIGTGAAAKTIHIGDGASANIITMGSTTAGATTTLQGANSLTNGIALNAGGFVSVQTPAQVTGGGTNLVLNSRVGQVNYTGLGTPVDSFANLTLQNSTITTNSVVFFSTNISGTEDAIMALTGVQLSAGSAAMQFKNIGGDPLATNLQVKFWVLN